jgi:hypothetical protein
MPDFRARHRARLGRPQVADAVSDHQGHKPNAGPGNDVINFSKVPCCGLRERDYRRYRVKPRARQYPSLEVRL